MPESTDRIDRQIVLHAPLARVWRAISDSREFGSWFGLAIDGPFVRGTRITGRIAPTTADPQVAELQKPYTGTVFELWIERIEPMGVFSFRWHPYAVEPGIDYSKEETTLVVFELAESAPGTRLTISESGFDRIPLARRAKALAANAGGWSHQVRLIEKYLAMHPAA